LDERTCAGQPACMLLMYVAWMEGRNIFCGLRSGMSLGGVGGVTESKRTEMYMMFGRYKYRHEDFIMLY
jgi:hypothetical protein